MTAKAWSSPIGPRGWVLLSLLASAVWASVTLDLDVRRLVPTDGGWSVAAEFLARAVSPALTYEAAVVPSGTRPLLIKAAEAARMTLAIAAAAMSLALVAGGALGLCASTFWWRGSAPGVRRRLPLVMAYAGLRVLIAVMRSIHELFWAVLLLAAFGLGNLTAVVAIAIPYTGVLAKVFSELIDEAPRDAGEALDGLGASRFQAFIFGVLPRALPDMGAYAFYRFECALRSSAILGFFGFPTLGYYVTASFENLHYGEVWSYLYVLFALIALVDWWSGQLRRRLVA